jgi:glycosyltransferase involved in cell wall biosynthesis
VHLVRLSALVCVQNQEAQLSDCLRRLSFCDEIVVVADRCTDRSQEIARRHGAVVIDGIFPLENQRRQAGVQACSGDWILEIEPDERVDTALAWEVRAMLQIRPAADAFEIPVDNHVGEALVRDGWTGPLSPARGLRLYRPGMKIWRPRRADAGMAQEAARVSSLKGAIKKHLGRDIGGLLERFNRLTSLQAEDLADTYRPALLSGGVAKGASRFFGSYLARGGWREGRLGLLVAVLNGLYPVVVQMRTREVLAARRSAVPQAEALQPLGRVVGLAGR